MTDKVLTCRDCGKEFTFTAGEHKAQRRNRDNRNG